VCDLFGVSFLSFLLVLANGALYEVARFLRSRTAPRGTAPGDSPEQSRVRPLRRLIGIASPSETAAVETNGERARSLLAPLATLSALLVAVLGYGLVRLDQVERVEAAAETLRLGVVEPEIPIFEEQLKSFPKEESPLSVLKWNTLSLQAASARLVETENPDLLVWPESTYFPALSVYARRTEADFVTLEGRRVVLHREGASPTAFEAAEPLLAVATRGDGRTFVVGRKGTVYAVTPQGLTREAAPVATDLGAAWYGCTDVPAYLDTPEDQCLPMAAGDSGTLLARSKDGWVKLETGSTADLLVLAGFSAGKYVAAGRGEILAGNVTKGVIARSATPGVVWAAAAARGPTAILVAESGSIARVTATGEISLSSKKIATDGSIRAVDLLPDGTLLLATSAGLALVGHEPVPRFLHPAAMRSVSCDADGACLALADDGGIFSVTADGEVEPVAGGNPEATHIALLPFSRYYWWLPDDAKKIYKATAPVPREPRYPDAVIADLGQPERTVNAVQRGFDTPILFGATSGRVFEIEDPNSLRNIRYNSAFVADRDGRVLGRYDKQYLLAFGEYIPLGDWFPILYEWSPESGRFLPGPASEPLDFEGHRLGVLICYEDIIPGHTNSVAAAGAHALVNLSNDAWFGKTKEAWQHFVLAAFRAVEQRLPLVRATTTGISGFVSATGEIRYMTDPEGAETFVVDLPLLEDSWTVYRAGGRHFPWVLGLLLAGLAVAILRKRQVR